MRKKRFLSILALLCLTVSSAWAQGPWTSGNCTVTLSNGTMTVSGNGAMADYGSEEDRPWHDYSSNITSLVVESGVTTIGSRAFYNCTALTSVTLPEGLTAINVCTFYGCSGLTTLTIPSTVTSIDSNDAFFICTSMTDVYLYADPANLTWPEDGDDFQDNNATNCHVLAEHLAAYQSNFPEVNVTFVGDLQPQAPAAAATENVTITFNDFGLENAYDLTSGPLTVGNIELSFDKADGSNPPAFYTTGGGTARIYKGNTMSISAGGATITKIVFTYASDVTPAFSTGSYNATTKTWEGEATTLTLINAYTTNTQIRIKSMDVYYSVASAAGETAYTVTLKEGTEDAGNWTITPPEAKTTGVFAGTEVTATYSGTRHVKSVKATKKGGAAPTAKAAAEATAEDKGKLIGTDGNIYADVAAATAAGTTAVAKIIYIGETGHATYTHGLALALTDEAESGKMTWQAAINACSAKNTSTPVTNATWLLASEAQWGYMSGDNGAGGYEALRDGFSGISGASNLQEESYWSSTEVDSTDARVYLLEDGDWDFDSKNAGYRARACLAF